MPLLLITAVLVAVAVLAGAAHAGDYWVCSLLSAACLLNALGSAYQERTLPAFASLLGGAAFAGASVHSLYVTSRQRRQP
ncbi:hypothetical protein ACFZC3_15250 [Streptomyces sp. NPDC007903]|uniref:hypothetical protein n=1 Tax=Streptomyces sp. NPDC007903 TaxID=3364786 RepID=UPI0036EE5EBA